MRPELTKKYENKLLDAFPEAGDITINELYSVVSGLFSVNTIRKYVSLLEKQGVICISRRTQPGGVRHYSVVNP